MSDEKVEIIIKFWPVSIYLFNILCDEVGGMHTALLLGAKVWWLSGGKALLQLFELQLELLLFSWNIFYLKE